MGKKVFSGVLLLTIFVVIELVNAHPSYRQCPPMELKNGKIRSQRSRRIIKYICNTGYILAGDKYNTCVRGQWESPIPKCVRPTCAKVVAPINGQIYPSHRGAVLNFFCKSGYVLRGPNAIFCDGRHWDNNLPSCIQNNTKPATSCDFESEDLCGWTQDLRHDFDWTRMNSKTPSGYLGTGPSYDHTKGEGNFGYYMYIESSSRNENDTARLISPIYDKTTTDACFKFYYHMYGSSMGSLRIYVKKFDDNWDLNPANSVFNRSGNHGDEWRKGFVKFGPIDQDFQIIIEGVNGPSYVSDLAIDDVQLIENCTGDDELTTTTESYVTVPVLQTESCINRCDSDNVVLPQDSFQISCDCNDECVDKNSCCPDYFSVCVAGTTEDLTTNYPTASFETVTHESPTTNKTKKTENDNTRTNSVLPKDKGNESPILNFKNDTIVASPTKIPLPASDVTSMLMTTRVFSNVTTPRSTVPQKITLIFLTPPSTKAIVRKVPPRESSTASTIVASVKKMTSSISASTATPTTARVPVSTSKVSFTTKTSTKIIDEVMTVPTRQDVEILPPIVATKETRRKEENSEMKETNPKNAKIVIRSSKTDSKFTIAVVSSVAVVLIVVVCVVVLVRRYSVTGCRRMGRFKSTGDSQSDVRFLTSDEHLDFTLARPGDYDTL